ncbi:MULTISPECIES: IclR family transcriptional regulator [Microbacterium]|mgnify:CR=1 FL=1|uniref:IclR family transcriptional regulator n=1 Tax=Microbacterium TaxID=33882 RepID=UPI0016574EF7|nr:MULTISPECIES: IclR family transcriptional regulator [Microbacterium]MCT1363803.1 IclR family transcriptional regulator [Microbacterium sp. p3-SID131]MCT1375397.1 IclR family transcriptional regulator [Microbacterium sp. p3-SID337]MCZ0711450.1 IclR family transcriptional regulator [Microbacterium paraoxydans]MDH5134137.1 IclR family transcriptional regulator [Microbacterium sp. RD10]MDH5137720.1 IclR family transcriptional regulator [Microbacterium sp. RD11]
MNAAEAEPTLIGSVQRALRLVDIVANSPRPLPAKMLSSITGLTPGTTYNLVRTLVHEGYLSAEPDGLVLGGRFPSFQQQIDSRGVFLARVRAALRAVTEDVGATAYLSRYADGEMHLVDIVDSVRNPRIELWVGLHASAHATALGKQILAALSEEDRLDYLSRHRLEELTPRTISDRRTLLTQLEQTPGWAVDREEYAIGATCVAVPVIAPGVTASLAVSLPADRAVVNRRLVSNLQRTARRLSLQLGADALDTDGPDAEFTI